MSAAGESPGDDRIALLGTGHSLDHVASERRVQVPEEADGSAVLAHGHEDGDFRRLGHLFGFNRLALLIDSLEPFALEENVGGILSG